MALSVSDLPAMYTLLSNSLSRDESLRKPAESTLAQSENLPGFCSCLMEVIIAKDLVPQADVRLMASLYFKNSINRYWRNKRDSSGLTKEEKSHLRQKLLSHLREENYQISLTLAVLISKIARIDYPREWPELFSVLAQQIQSADVLASHRIFMILFRTLKELSTKRLTSDQRNFAEISSQFFDYSWHLCQSDMQTNFSEKLRFDAVIHFAGLKAVGESVHKPLMYYNNNIIGTITLLEVMAAYECKKFVFSSSATVYGWPKEVPCTEEFPLSAANPYGRTKVFDGQGVPDAATYVRQNILKFNLEDSQFPVCLEKAIQNAFVKADHAFADNTSFDISSGTTALTALVFGRLLGECVLLKQHF